MSTLFHLYVIIDFSSRPTISSSVIFNHFFAHYATSRRMHFSSFEIIGLWVNWVGTLRWRQLTMRGATRAADVTNILNRKFLEFVRCFKEDL